MRVLLGMEGLDLFARVALPPTVGYLAQRVAQFDWLPVRRRQEPGGIPGADEGARVECGDRFLAEPRGEFSRLLRTCLRERDVRLTGEPVLGGEDGGAV